MKVVTKVRFREKDDYSIVHEVGSVFECSEERGKYLVNLGFVESYKEPKAVKVEKETTAEQPKEAKRKKKNTMPFGDNEATE